MCTLVDILVDIPDLQIQKLAKICAAEKKSRAKPIRATIAEYIEKRQSTIDDFLLTPTP